MPFLMSPQDFAERAYNAIDAKHQLPGDSLANGLARAGPALVAELGFLTGCWLGARANAGLMGRLSA